MFHIYIVTNIVNAMQYVGVTNNLDRRWSQHRSMNGTSRYLHAAIKKHGIENFVFTHVATAFDLENAFQIEKILISEHKTKSPDGYNLTDGGEGCYGYKVSEETRAKMREARAKQIQTPEANEKRRKAMLGNKHGVGKIHTEDHKKKIGKAGLGRKHSDESKKKMSIAMTGRKRSAETIAKQIGKKASPEARENMRKAHLGKKLYPESIAKRTATQALNRAKRLAEKDLA
jgi:group I intron endonuclease